MTEHLTPDQINDHCRRKLSPADLLRADDHLAECIPCRQSMEAALNQTGMGLYAELAAETPAGAHPTFEQNAAYIDGLLDDEERRQLQDHFASCVECARLADDLRAFRNEIAPELDREFRPAESKPEAPPPRFQFRFPVLAWAAALALLAVAGWLLWRAPATQPPPQIALASPTPIATTAPATPVLARLNDGGAVLELDAQGRLSGTETWPQSYQQLAKEALSNQRVERSPLLAGLGRPASALMGGPDEESGFALLDPAGKVVLSDRPTLRWSKLEGADSYVVEIYDAQFNLAASSSPLPDLSWTPPPLPRGQIFSWQVKALKDGQEFIAPRPPAPQARFRIVDQAAAAEITRLRRDFPTSHLLLGLAYAQAGLVVEAERELRALQKANGDQPGGEIAGKLLGSVARASR